MGFESGKGGQTPREHPSKFTKGTGLKFGLCFTDTETEIETKTEEQLCRAQCVESSALCFESSELLEWNFKPGPLIHLLGCSRGLSPCRIQKPLVLQGN